MLLVDAGNTRIKLDWLKAGSACRAGRVHAFTLDEPETARDWLSTLPARPSRALGVNVAGEPVALMLESLLGRPVEWVKAGASALGVRNGYRDPAQLGADRWAAMLGLARHERERRSTTASAIESNAAAPWPGRACALLANFGTATTIDTLRPLTEVPAGGDAVEGAGFEFQGGVILPGPALMLSSLSEGTANLPLGQGDAALYPTHTLQAIATGVAAAQAGAVLRQWMAGLEQGGLPPEVYVSGGGWPAVRDETVRLLASARGRLGLPEQPVRCLDAPVLDGLACLACAAPNEG